MGIIIMLQFISQSHIRVRSTIKSKDIHAERSGLMDKASQKVQDTSWKSD